MESEGESAIGDIQDILIESPERRGIGGFSEKELPFKGSVDESRDVFNLNLSIEILEAETEEIETEFLDALTEIEEKQLYHCTSCDKICKSKGGLTKHTNTKHREISELLSSTESDITLDGLTRIVEAIKADLITEDLYGSEINKHIKSASCSEDLFDAVLPLYNKFCRKKNQDKLLEEFYGLMPNASKYLSCANSSAASIIMIDLPDHLVGHLKAC